MPLKCRGCKHYCLTQYKPEYHGMVEGCGASKTNTQYPYYFTKKEDNTDGSMGCVQ